MPRNPSMSADEMKLRNLSMYAVPLEAITLEIALTWAKNVARTHPGFDGVAMQRILQERVRLLVEQASHTGAYSLSSSAANNLRAGICRALGIDEDAHEGDEDLIKRLTEAVSGVKISER
jgi:hypothetical protein